MTESLSKSNLFFNTSGPSVPGEHYMLPTEARFKDVRKLIADRRYFVLHAPRQTGKTTVMLQLMEALNHEGEYIALYVNIEAGQAYRDKLEGLNRCIIQEIALVAEIYLPSEYKPSSRCTDGVTEFSVFLSRWCMELPKPLVLFVDEVDALIGDGLLSVLRQLRSGYSKRPKAFPHALCMIGLRDIRDYRIYSDRSDRYIIGGSAFNIKDKSCTLADFTAEEVVELYAQHTKATGQMFSKDALARVYEITQGQPWLVNALGRELCFEEYAVLRNQQIEVSDVDEKAEILIRRRDVHLDQLSDKLTEPRVAKVIEAVLSGAQLSIDVSQEDQQYVLDLGLIKKRKMGLEVANPIYREVIPRELTVVIQDNLAQDPHWYVTSKGKLDIEKVVERFIDFYRENGEMLTARKQYTEAAHHLLFMAWLQRIVNGGGRITREYALGLKRLDLCIDFAGEKFAFELKLDAKKVLQEGQLQLSSYLERLDLKSGFLIIFTRSFNESILGKRELITGEKQIKVLWL